MGLNDDFPYSLLETETQIRVVILAPGEVEDDPIHCYLLTIDLNADLKNPETTATSSSLSDPKRMSHRSEISRRRDYLRLHDSSAPISSGKWRAYPSIPEVHGTFICMG